MREIKFRAWDKKEKKMYYRDNPRDLFPSDCNTKIMQYTGLKDKNGKEIYEGDIVNKGYGSTFKTIDEINVVEMGTGQDSDGYYHGKWYGWKAGESSLLDVNKECKVIGNIYENPELLNNDK